MIAENAPCMCQIPPAELETRKDWTIRDCCLTPIPSGDERAPMTPEERATCLTQIRASIEEEAVRIGFEYATLNVYQVGDEIVCDFRQADGKGSRNIMPFAVVDGGAETPEEAGKSIVGLAASAARYRQQEGGKQ